MEFGATDFVNAAETDAAAAIRAMLPGSGLMSAGGVDWSFECVGHPAVLRTSIDILERGGTCVAVGTKTYPLDQFDTVAHDMEEGKLARGVLTF